MGSAVSDAVARLADAAAPGSVNLDDGERERLRALTARLLDVHEHADDDYARYREIRSRQLDVSSAAGRFDAAYRGKRVLVTGGTGCIGTELIGQLLEHEPAELTCLYALSGPFTPIPGVTYVRVDIRDELATRDAIRRARPDVIIHCAAQRSPWLAEREVTLTLGSNVVGTRNVLRGARDIDLERFVHASTGKALRYRTNDIYAASKKLAEWLVFEYASEGRAAGIARFTHLVDNAVVMDRVDESMSQPGSVMRLHDPHAMFYAQSARESAQLLQLAGLEVEPKLHCVTIRSLGEPAVLLGIVVGRMRALRKRSPYAPTLYVSGPDKGYEIGNPPGLYDPATALDVSPLINAIEAAGATEHELVENVDRFSLTLPADGHEAQEIADRIERSCSRPDPSKGATALADGIRQQAEAMFLLCPEPVFARIEKLASRAGVSLPTTRRGDSSQVA